MEEKDYVCKKSITTLLSKGKIVLFIDNCGYGDYSEKILEHFIKDQGIYIHHMLNIESFITFTGGRKCFLKHLNSEVDYKFLETGYPVSIIIPSVNKLLHHHETAAAVFELVQQIKENLKIRRLFLWCEGTPISEEYFIGFLEYLSDVIVNVNTDLKLSIVARNPGGSITKLEFDYGNGLKEDDQKFEENNRSNAFENSLETLPDEMLTFRIELDDKETIARNAMIMPYEITNPFRKIFENHFVYSYVNNERVQESVPTEAELVNFLAEFELDPDDDLDI